MNKEQNQKFKQDLSIFLNERNMDDYCNTPDYVLAEFLFKCLLNYKETKRVTDKWHQLPKLNSIKL